MKAEPKQITLKYKVSLSSQSFIFKIKEEKISKSRKISDGLFFRRNYINITPCVPNCTRSCHCKHQRKVC